VIDGSDNECNENDIEAVFQKVVFCRREQSCDGEPGNGGAAEQCNQGSDDQQIRAGLPTNESTDSKSQQHCGSEGGDSDNGKQRERLRLDESAMER
jgi:hypothetical protein